jgi:hypothetical protein
MTVIEVLLLMMTTLGIDWKINPDELQFHQKILNNPCLKTQIILTIQ